MEELREECTNEAKDDKVQTTSLNAEANVSNK